MSPPPDDKAKPSRQGGASRPGSQPDGQGRNQAGAGNDAYHGDYRDDTSGEFSAVPTDVHETLLPSLKLSVHATSKTPSSSRRLAPVLEPAAFADEPSALPPAPISVVGARPPSTLVTVASPTAEPNATDPVAHPQLGAAAGADRRGAKPGDVIGARYLVEGQLGRGGMGRVLKVRHQALGKSFALKLIKAPIAMDPKIREMFYREARLASSLVHDNICSVVDFGEDPAYGLFMVMELLDGQTLHHRTRGVGPLAAKAACDVMWQVCQAVRFIHARAIIHGDLKSENVLLVKGAASRRVAKLLDFGLARPAAKSAQGVDGTPEYLAPERIKGGPATAASDIYALGIMFFEMLTGKLPFTGNIDDVFTSHLNAPMPRAADHGAELDERADELIAKATAKDPALRHQDVASFVYELQTLMNMLGMEATRRRAAHTQADGFGGTRPGQRERREIANRLKAEAEVFGNMPLPLASVALDGAVRVANAAFLEFVGAAGQSAAIRVQDTGLLDVCPSLLADLREVLAKRAPVKRVVYLSEGAGRLVEAALVITPAPPSAEVTAGEVHLLLHPLRAIEVS